MKEAEQYWGYLISGDRTGTDKLKRLLGGLHSLIVSTSFFMTFYQFDKVIFSCKLAV